MLFSALFLLPALVAGVAASSETPGCRTLTPSFIGTINSWLPDTITDNDALVCDTKELHLKSEPGVTFIYKDTTGAPEDHVYVDAIIEFTNIPADAWGCHLELNFAPGYNKILFYDSKKINIDIWSVGNAVADVHALTWNNAPNAKQHISTVTDIDMPRHGVNHYNQPHYELVQHDLAVNSMTCKEKMTFRIRVPAEVQHGGVEFKQEEQPFGGWTLKHNCK